MAKSAPVYEFDAAIVRRPAPSVVNGLRAGDQADPTFDGVSAEHAAYVKALSDAGVEVTVLTPLDEFPDSIFVEDPALVFSEGAILLRPGAKSRAGEAAQLAPTLEDHFEIVQTLPGPGFADGGDILTTPDAVMIGLSARTNREGAKALSHCLKNFGRKSVIVETPEDVLHFKTDCALLDEETVLTTARLSRSGVFSGLNELIAPAGEEPAANALRVNDVVMIGAEYPRTIDLLDSKGFKTVPLNVGEIGKIDAGLSCMSLRWKRVQE